MKRMETSNLSSMRHVIVFRS